MRRNAIFWCASLVAALGGAACDGSFEVGTESAESLGGGTASAFPNVCVMHVAVPDASPIACSCALIEDQTVLTSARCVYDNVAASMIDGIEVAFGNQFPPGGGGVIPIDSIEVHRYFDPDVPNRNELALIRLVDAPSATPVVLNERPLGADDVGTDLTLVGYGVTDAGDSSLDTTRNQITTPITQVADEYLFAGTTDASSCPGDSGGPGFADLGDGEVLVSINQRQADCSPTVQRVRVDRFVDSFLYPYIDRFSGPCVADGNCVTTGCRTPDPDCDDCAWGNGVCAEDCPTRDWDCDLGAFAGESCTSSGECEEGGRCVAAADDESFTYCSRACDPAAADCPAGMECTEAVAGDPQCTFTTPSPGSQGYACTSNDACRSGICEGDICVFPCDAGQCPAPYQCGPSEVSPGTDVCLGEVIEGGGGFCAVGGDGSAWLGLLAVLGLALVSRRRSVRPRRGAGGA